MSNEDMKKAATWAFLTAKKFGWTWYNEGTTIWVKTAEHEIGCSNLMDFVSLVSEANKDRHVGY